MKFWKNFLENWGEPPSPMGPHPYRCGRMLLTPSTVKNYLIKVGFFIFPIYLFNPEYTPFPKKNFWSFFGYL
jgi:hypothetical protein